MIGVFRGPGSETDMFVRGLADADVRSPLWYFAPAMALPLLSERARRGFHDLIATDPADPEYA